MAEKPLLIWIPSNHLSPKWRLRSRRATPGGRSQPKGKGPTTRIESGAFFAFRAKHWLDRQLAFCEAGLVCIQSTVTMRACAVLSSHFSLGSTARRTADSEYLFRAGILFLPLVEFAQFLGKLVKTDVPVSIHFQVFCARGAEKTGTIWKFTLLLKKTAHLRADLVRAVVTHCEIMPRSQRACWSILNTP